MNWDKAKEYLDMVINEYEALPGGVGIFGLTCTLVPLRKRYESGERTAELYDEMMSVE